VFEFPFAKIVQIKFWIDILKSNWRKLKPKPKQFRVSLSKSGQIQAGIN
jgi:hypothetical protein